MSNTPKIKSRFFGQRIVKHSFQLRFSLMIFALLSVAVLAIWGHGRIVIHHFSESGLLQDAQMKIYMEALNSTVVAISLFSLMIFFILTIIYSHSIAGPIYRFERIFESMEKGKLTMKAKLRKSDEFQEVAEMLNRGILSLNSRIKAERNVVDSNLGELLNIARVLDHANQKEQATKIRQICELIKSDPSKIIL